MPEGHEDIECECVVSFCDANTGDAPPRFICVCENRHYMCYECIQEYFRQKMVCHNEKCTAGFHLPCQPIDVCCPKCKSSNMTQLVYAVLKTILQPLRIIPYEEKRVLYFLPPSESELYRTEVRISSENEAIRARTTPFSLPSSFPFAPESETDTESSSFSSFSF